MRGWFDRETRKEYVINFGYKQLAYDFGTTLIETIWKAVMTAIHLVLLVIYWPLKLIVLLIEYIFDLALHQREFFWRKRAFLKMELIRAKERRY